MNNAHILSRIDTDSIFLNMLIPDKMFYNCLLMTDMSTFNNP